MKMVDVNTIYTSDTLKAADLQGREHTVTIASVESREFDNGIKLVLKFVGAKKAFICNKTNGKRIAFIHGDETNGWVGKKVVLAPEMVSFRGETVWAIRVKPAAVSEPPIKPAMVQQPRAENPTQGMNDDIGF
jgi:hypothetical protein